MLVTVQGTEHQRPVLPDYRVVARQPRDPQDNRKICAVNHVEDQPFMISLYDHLQGNSSVCDGPGTEGSVINSFHQDGITPALEGDAMLFHKHGIHKVNRRA